MSPERPIPNKPEKLQNPLSQGQTLNAASDALQAVKAFELTIDSLASDYRDGNFLARNGPNLDSAMETREQCASMMRIYQVKTHPDND